MSQCLPLQCPSCGIRLEYDHDSCPECQEPLSPAERHLQEKRNAGNDTPFSDQRTGLPAEIPAEEPLQTIARFANAAEAGFFAHTLQHTRNIPTWIRAEENFDALSGFWSTRYHLVVPQRFAESSARLLQSLLERSEREDFEEFAAEEENGRATAKTLPFSTFEESPDSFAEPAPQAGEQGRNWVPLVLTLAAGSLALVGFRAWQPAAQPRPAVPGKRQQEVWDELSRPQRPWIQHVEGEHWRVLQFSRDRSKLILREYNGPQQISEKEFPLSRPE